MEMTRRMLHRTGNEKGQGNRRPGLSRAEGDNGHLLFSEGCAVVLKLPACLTLDESGIRNSVSGIEDPSED